MCLCPHSPGITRTVCETTDSTATVRQKQGLKQSSRGSTAIQGSFVSSEIPGPQALSAGGQNNGEGEVRVAPIAWTQTELGPTTSI